jgi:hypothetical protein
VEWINIFKEFYDILNKFYTCDFMECIHGNGIEYRFYLPVNGSDDRRAWNAHFVANASV